jgi:hypothetical protein
MSNHYCSCIYPVIVYYSNAVLSKKRKDNIFFTGKLKKIIVVVEGVTGATRLLRATVQPKHNHFVKQLFP